MSSTLAIATEGPCQGHPCDNCKQCQRGRCCRRDNPNYKLPELGAWDGPIYGELGVLNEDGDKVECHCCGEWYTSLAAHVWWSHDLTAAEYKALFGLRAGRGLHSKERRQRFVQIHGERLKSSDQSGRIAERVTPEQNQALRMGQHKRLESRQSSYGRPVLPETRQKIAAAAQGRTLSPEARQKIGDVHRGRKKSDQTIERRLATVRALPKRKGNASSPYKGVSWHAGKQKWIAYLDNDGQRVNIGTFDDEIMAAQAYDARAKQLWGDGAYLNFPDAQP